MTPQEHNKVLGLAHLGYGGLHLLMMLLFFIMSAFFLGLPIRNSEAMSLITFMMLVFFGGSLLFTLPSLIAGYALLKRKSWARTAAIVAALPAVAAFPYGTALAAYTFWFISSDAGKEFYGERSAGWPPTGYGQLPNTPAADNWAQGGPYNQRERVPKPPQMPDWR